MEKIIGIGLDQIEIDRVQKACNKQSFIKKYFTEAEQELISYKKSRAATNFAGKEAVAKCLGTGFAQIAPIEIEILRRETGAPYVRLYGNAKRIAHENEITKIHISLTDTKTMAAAYAVAVGEIE